MVGATLVLEIVAQTRPPSRCGGLFFSVQECSPIQERRLMATIKKPARSWSIDGNVVIPTELEGEDVQ
jgi:hypothetical protein